MPVFTRPRSFTPRLLAVLMAFAGLASGCQSSRSSFSFQPLVLRAATLRAQAATPAPAPEAANAASVTAAMPSAPAMARVPVQPRPGHVAPATTDATAAKLVNTQLSDPVIVKSHAAVPARARFVALHRRPWLRRAQAPAEAGLGLTVLGLLAIVVLVVALVGLAISGGGLGWIITAAIAAGVLLLAYIDPHGH
jgi:hypothetical protein